MDKELKKRVDDTYAVIKRKGMQFDYIKALYQCAYLAVKEQNDRGGIGISKNARWCIEKRIKQSTKMNIWQFEYFCMQKGIESEEIDLYYDCLLLESFYEFESYIFYMERRRDPKKRFYVPRRNTLNVVVKDLQEFEDSTTQVFYGLSMPARTGKSTICIFFLSWLGLKRPNSHNAMGGHSGVLAKGFHKELLNFINSSEYTFGDMYNFWHPNHRIVCDKSAEDLTITLDEPDRFATFTCRGIDGTWTGAVDVSADGYLYVDDLIRDREHSLSPTRMENTYQEYLNKMVDRKNDGAKELMVGTLWNVMDPLERMRKAFDGDSNYKFRRIPALNDDGQSNFAYSVNGFSTKYYMDMKARLDDAEWMAKYQQKPYVREGILLPADELRYFNGILPEGSFQVVAVCDIAWGGGDSLSMPIGALYENGECYIFSWVFSRGTKETTLPLVVGRIIENGIRQIRFEGNQGGELYQKYVDERLSASNWKCSTTSRKAPNTITKTEKIIAYSGDVKRKFVFLQQEKPSPKELAKEKELGIVRYTRDREYQRAMDEVTTFVTIGKNEHDDAIDSLTQLEMFIDGDKGSATASAVMNPFRSRY